MNVLNRPLFRQAGGPAQPVAQDVGQEIQRVATQLDYLNTMASVEPNLAKKEQAILAIQNLAQTTPPEIFRAAQKLVQDTKASRNPNVMVNPNMDPGNQSFVSPVNRANGGEMMAPPMPPPMAAEQMMAAAPPPPPPEVEMLAQAEAGATAQGQELGAAYAQQMMAGIDGAQSTEDLINALRGNDKPLDARREELAGYVGQSDANQTPESVLAMVQPVIMMTEEGMMDSGIGALVQQITGDVEMTTASGAPTDMGMGVGSLMAAGAQEAPAPQNFRQGGAVQRFEEGGAVAELNLGDVKTRYEQLSPLFLDIISEGREQEAAERAKLDEMMFYSQLGQLGLNLASGSGKGGSFVSELAEAAKEPAANLAALGAQAQERRSALRAEDRAARSGAFQGALTIEQQALADRNALNLAISKALATKKAFSPEYLENAAGDVVVLDKNTADQATFDQYIALGYQKQSTEGSKNFAPEYFENAKGELRILNKATAKQTDFDNLIANGFRKVSSDSGQNFLPEYFYNQDTGEVKILNRATATGEMFQNVLTEGFIPGKPSATKGGTEAERGREMFSKNYDAYADGTLDAETTRLINMFLTDQYGVRTEFKTVYDAQSGQEITKPVRTQAAIPQTVSDAINRRSELGKSLPGITPPDAPPPPAVGTAVVGQAGTTAPAPVVSEEAVATSVSAPAEKPMLETEKLLTEYAQTSDMSSAFGSPGAIVEFLDSLLPAVSGATIAPLAPNIEGLQALYTSEVEAAVSAAIQGYGDKATNALRAEIRKVTPQTGQFFTSKYKAYAQHEAFLAKLEDSLAAAQARVNDPTVRSSQSSLNDAKRRVSDIERSIGFWRTATRELRNSVYGGGKTVEDRLNEMGMEPTGTNIIRQMDADVESVMSGI